MLFMNGPFTNIFCWRTGDAIVLVLFLPSGGTTLRFDGVVYLECSGWEGNVWKGGSENSSRAGMKHSNSLDPFTRIFYFFLLWLSCVSSGHCTVLLPQWKWACKVSLCEKFQFMFLIALLCPLYYPQNFILKLFPPFWLIPPLPLSSICLVVQISTLPCGQIEKLFHGFDRILIMIWRMMKMRVVMMMLMMMRNTL